MQSQFSQAQADIPLATEQGAALARATIVIPVYNRKDMLAACLHSLRPALDAGAALIVVDDGSSDGSAAVAEAFRADHAAARMQVIVQQNAGPGAARNTGVAAAATEWIVFVDSDDLWLGWSAGALAAALPQAKDAAAIFFSSQGFAGDPPTGWAEAPLRVTRHPGFFDMRSQMKGLIGSGYFAIRKDAIDQLGGFLPHIRGGEDMDLFYRLEGMAEVLAIHEPIMVAAREDNADSLTKSMKSVAQGLGLLIAQQRAGRYSSPATRTALADALQFWLRTLCNAGYGRAAYDLLRRGGLSVLWAEGRRGVILKLLLHPLLSKLRPRNYQFGWGPRLAS